MTYSIRASSEADAVRVTAQIRLSDLQDIRAASPLPPTEAVLLSHRSSHLKFGLFKHDECFAVGGLASEPSSGRSSIWLVGTDLLSDSAKSYGIKRSRAVLNVITRPQMSYFNYVEAGNRSCRRWLGALGFAEEREHTNFRDLGYTVVEVVYRR